MLTYLEEFQKQGNISFNLFGHTAFHLGGYVYVFGGGLVNKSSSNLMHMIKSGPFSIQIGCSQGTINKGNYCESYAKGHYFDNWSCEPCPKKHFLII